MDGRKQFTFYRSFWEAVQTLPKKDRLPVLEAIISYALDGTVPQGLTTGQSAFFLLVKPNLDAARRKAESGKQGGSKKKANASKLQANSKQTESKKENEIENEIENKCYACEEGFASFWDAYPRKEGRQKALEAFAAVDAPLDLLLSAIDAQKKSKQWQKDDGAFIPMPANWLKDRRWEDAPASAAPAARQLDDDERAAIAKMMEET